ncbi:cell division protein ZapC domain-containing protein [Catenovulum sediminis]|uniref:Cell division protein ZapC domain-containing protein n=1 Tax=Catenovulum sediminis TaxID=1740262 RepID=A0ABV1RJT6_9ALTE|nr:cell division protein ZapC domain-containing protein [Catenovulum sediminis]
MLQAKADWYWFYDLDSHTMRLNMTDFVFVTACKASKLIPSAKQTVAFSVADNQSYTEFYSIVEEQLAVSEAICAQIALNAVAQKKFMRPEQPKSWYFLEQHKLKRNLFDQVVMLKSEMQQGIFLIIDENNEFASVMLLSANMKLDERKTLKQFECIKVLQNRIAPLQQPHSVQSRNHA